MAGILLKQEQDNGVNDMANQKHRDKSQPISGRRLLKDRRNQNEEPDDLELPPDLEHRSAQQRITQKDRRDTNN